MSIADKITGAKSNSSWAIVTSQAVIVVPAFIYQTFYFFSYYPITEGWFSTYGAMIRSGEMPYRDFTLLLPPLYPLQIALFQSLFGNELIALRVIGMFVTIGIGLSLHAILRQFFNPFAAAFAALIALIYYQSGVAFIGYDFTQFLTLYLLLGGYFLLKATTNKTGSGRQALVALVLGGAFLASAALIKQSNGGVASAVLALAYGTVIARRRGLLSAVRDELWIGVGVLIPLLPILVWLSLNGALGECLHQIYFDALRAKGGSDRIFTSWLFELYGGSNFLHYGRVFLKVALPTIIAAIGLAIISLALTWAVWKKYRLGQREPLQMFLGRIAQLDHFAVGLTGAVAVAAVAWVIFHFNVSLPGPLPKLRGLVTLYLVIGATSLYLTGGAISFAALLVSGSNFWAAVAMLFSIALGLTFGNGTSGGLSEISAFLGVGVVIAAALEATASVPLAQLVPVGLSVAICGAFMYWKFVTPYYWWSVRLDDVRTVKCAHTTGLLRGLCVPRAKYDDIKSLTQTIERYSHPGEAIVVFPHEPIFYLLAMRRPFDRTPVTWFDFIAFAQMEAYTAKVRARVPPVMIVTRLPEAVFKAHEFLFNDGKPSAQRDFIKTVDDLATAGRIARVATMTIDALKLDVYVRTDRLKTP